jgi:hypothetical protein
MVESPIMKIVGAWASLVPDFSASTDLQEQKLKAAIAMQNRRVN